MADLPGSGTMMAYMPDRLAARVTLGRFGMAIQ